MSENPFSSFNVEMPKKYDERVRQFCATSGRGRAGELAPFGRQIDFWFTAFIIAAKKRLDPIDESDTYNVTPASILSTDPYRITHIQSVFLSFTNDIDGLADDRKVFDFSIRLTNAGIPFLIQILDESDLKPIWNITDYLDAALKKR